MANSAAFMMANVHSATCLRQPVISLSSSKAFQTAIHSLANPTNRGSRKLVLSVRSAGSAADSTVSESKPQKLGGEENGSLSLFAPLKSAIEGKDSEAVKKAMEELKEAGQAKLWASYPSVTRRTVFLTELTRIGIKNAENLAVPSVRNDAAFLASVVGVTSVLAVIAGQLPGDWGFFVPYLLGGVSLVVLAVGSVAPGLLQAATGVFSSTFPDYRDRLLRHEAAHFLVAYLLGVPIVGYSLDLGKEHTNLVDEKLQKRIYEGKLESEELDRLAVVSMAGLAAEGLKFDNVEGQSADLFSLQRLINRCRQPIRNEQQQNLTRWAVLFSASLIKNNAKAFEALMASMDKNSSVEECIAAIENSAL